MPVAAIYFQQKIFILTPCTLLIYPSAPPSILFSNTVFINFNETLNIIICQNLCRKKGIIPDLRIFFFFFGDNATNKR